MDAYTVGQLAAWAIIGVVLLTLTRWAIRRYNEYRDHVNSTQWILRELDTRKQKRAADMSDSEFEDFADALARQRFTPKAKRDEKAKRGEA